MDEWISDTNHIYRESPWLQFEDLNWSSITKGLIPDKFPRGSFVYHQNQANRFVYIIKSGRVNLSILNADGKIRSLFICCTGTLFGEISHFISPKNSAQAQAVSESIIYKVDKDRFQSIFMSNSTIAHNTAVVLAKKVRVLTAQMESTMFPDATKRVANMLLYLTEQYGNHCENGLKLNIRFSHQEVANLIGTSRVTVTNAFKQLTDERVILKSGSQFLLLDKGRLMEMLKW